MENQTQTKITIIHNKTVTNITLNFIPPDPIETIQDLLSDITSQTVYIRIQVTVPVFFVAKLIHLDEKNKAVYNVLTTRSQKVWQLFVGK